MGAHEGGEVGVVVGVSGSVGAMMLGVAFMALLFPALFLFTWTTVPDENVKLEDGGPLVWFIAQCLFMLNLAVLIAWGKRRALRLVATPSGLLLLTARGAVVASWRDVVVVDDVKRWHDGRGGLTSGPPQCCLGLRSARRWSRPYRAILAVATIGSAAGCCFIAPRPSVVWVSVTFLTGVVEWVLLLRFTPFDPSDPPVFDTTASVPCAAYLPVRPFVPKEIDDWQRYSLLGTALRRYAPALVGTAGDTAYGAVDGDVADGDLQDEAPPNLAHVERPVAPLLEEMNHPLLPVWAVAAAVLIEVVVVGLPLHAALVT